MTKTIKDKLTAARKTLYRKEQKREARRKDRRASRKYCQRVMSEDVWDDVPAPVQERLWMSRSSLFSWKMLTMWMSAKKHDGMTWDQLRRKLARKLDTKSRVGAELLKRFDEYAVDPDWCWYRETKLRDDNGVIRRYRRQGGRSWDDINAWLDGRSICTSGKKLFWLEEEFSDEDYDFQEQLTRTQWEQVLEKYDVTPEPILCEQSLEEAAATEFDLLRDGRVVLGIRCRVKKYVWKKVYFWASKSTSSYRPFRFLEWNGSKYVDVYYRTEYLNEMVQEKPLSDYELHVWNQMPREIRSRFLLAE